MARPSRILTLTALLWATSLVQAQQYTISQPNGGDTFGARSTGQTFTPSVGITPNPGSVATLPLSEITLYHGNYASATPSATTYLSIYEGDPLAGGTFVGSSSNAINTIGLVFHDQMTFTFNQIPLNYTAEHWAVFSSTRSAGVLDLEVCLEVHDRNNPNPYPGGSGLIANHAKHSADNDAKFEIILGLQPQRNFTISQPSGGDTFGARSTGQTFTPSVGINPVPGVTPSFLPLIQFTLYHGNYPSATPSATTYLSIYEGDPLMGGTFVGSSSNSINTIGLTFRDEMNFTFDYLNLTYTAEHWAVFSSTGTAGVLDLEVSLENHDRNNPNPYLGGSGLVANHVKHSADNDTKFEIVLDGGGGAFILSGAGCPSSTGQQATLSAPAFPTIGSTFQVDVSHLDPMALPYVIMGVSDQTWGSVPLPLSWSILFPTTPLGCDLLISPDLFFNAIPNGPNVGSVSVPLPALAYLRGTVFFVQGAQIEIIGSGVHIGMTAKGKAVIGG